MGGFRAGSGGLVVAALTALAVVGAAAPSYADRTVTVQGVAFPEPATANLTMVGCGDLYSRTDETPAPTIGVGPGVTPTGTRSLGWDLAGGNAVGAVFPVASMLGTTTASMAVNAAGHAVGVAYAGYQEPADANTSLLWIGRAELATPGGAWQTIDATDRVYTWAKYDMSTQQRVAPGSAVGRTVRQLAAMRGGDGPGVYMIGFGCDGTPFSMDTLRVGGSDGVTTYDIEGLRTTVTIGTAPADSPDEVTITGQLHTLAGAGIPHATMILERRLPDTTSWTQVLVAEVGRGEARAVVPRDEKAFYRWRFVERPLAEGSTSPALVLDVLPPLPTESPSPTDPASPTTAGPSPSSTPTTVTSPTTPATTPTTDEPSPSDSPSPTQQSTQQPTQQPTDEASPSPSGTPSESPPASATSDGSVAPTGSGSHEAP